MATFRNRSLAPAAYRNRYGPHAMTPGQFNRLTQEVAAAATVEDANEILGTVDLLDLSEDETAKLIDVARDKKEKSDV
jgi:hypothetical protein